MTIERTDVVETAPVADPRLDDPLEAVDHLVCCRGDWTKGLCGAETSFISLIVDRLCSMCMDEAERRLAPYRDELPVPEHVPCLWDGEPCPSDDELDRMIDDHLRD